MRILRAAAILALLVAPAYGQGIKPPPPSEPPKGKGESEAEKSTDSAYKRSLRNIPDQPAADPWGGARAADPKPTAVPAKKASKSAGSSNN